MLAGYGEATQVLKRDHAPFDSECLFVVFAYIAAFLGGIAVLELATLWLSRTWQDDKKTRNFGRYDLLTYLPLLLAGCFVWGIRVPLWVLITGVVGSKILLFSVVGGRALSAEIRNSGSYLSFLFFVSGFAALIYQIVWQRTLFSFYGVNIESTTIIVSLFMFGLGLGSLVGGVAAGRYPERAPELFLICECGIGAFGIISLPLIHYVSELTLHSSPLVVSMAVFGLLCIPTVLMGATLPILVGRLYRYNRNVGKSVGALYAINTAGSAVACFITADVLFSITGQQGAVMTAAACNLFVGFLVWRYVRRLSNVPDAKTNAACPIEKPGTATLVDKADSRGRVLILLFAAATGYISLSQEIIWMRIVSFMTGGRPRDFAHLLGLFLIGVAFGAVYGQRLCAKKTNSSSPARILGGLMIVSSITYYFSIAGIAMLRNQSLSGGLALTHILVVWESFLLGGVFTIVCHYVAGSGRLVGLAVSRVYAFNTAGCVMGPLLTGFVLMNRFGTDRLVLGLSIGGLAIGGLALLATTGRLRVAGPAAVVAAACALAFIHVPIYDRLYERMMGATKGQRFKYVIENRSGVITVQTNSQADTVFGGGVYDGKMSIDPVSDLNLIRRCYMIAALHPKPEEILEIGLSGGSWARVLADYQPLKELTVVEINPGYMELIRQYPSHSMILQDPKIKIEVDDGRRWLQRNPGRRFDFILQNTTFHWRSHVANLLSREYFALCKRHLKPGGVVYLNTTGSRDVAFTAAHVFRHVVYYMNFIAMSDEPFLLSPAQIRRNMLEFIDEHGPVFGRAETRSILDEMSNTPLKDIAPAILGEQNLSLITDDNMACEYED